MKASELRVGNIILGCNDLIGTVFNINQSTLRYYVDNELEDIYDNYENITAIPLTEEWFLRFGMIKDNGGNMLIPDNDECFLFNSNDRKEWTFYSCDFEPRLKYVHQLQNLYFVLTGRELEIKELV